MQLSEHFSLDEAIISSTAARLGIDNYPNAQQLSNMIEAANNLEILRSSINRAINVTSWLRVPALNLVIPGATNTPFGHSSGFCIDCSVSGISPYDLCKIAAKLYRSKNINFDQIIHEYGSWMHISFHPRAKNELLTIFRHNTKKYLDGILTKQEYLER